MEHTLQHPIGLLHLVTALLAIVAGLMVVFSKKGTRKHRYLGRAYAVLMVAVNATAFMIYELFGGFGLFHWMALLSLATVIIGYIPARTRSPGWRDRHAYFMSGSFVGLIAAFAAETMTRWLPVPFFAAVGIVSFLVSAIGIYLMLRLIPGIK